MNRFRLLLSLLVGLTVVEPAAATVTQRADGLVLCADGDTYTLRSAANKSGLVIRVKNTGTAACTVATTSAQTIDGANSYSVPPGAMVWFSSDAGNWVASRGATEVASSVAGQRINSHTIDVRSAPYYASCDARTTTTVGTTAPGPTVVLADAIGFSAGQSILIAGAGPGSATYIGKVTATNGTTITIYPGTSTSVSAGAWVAHDDTSAIQNAINDIFALGGGTIVGVGTSRINGPFQDPSGANGILVLPDRIAQWDSVPVDIRIKGLSSPAFSDQGSPDHPSAGGWIILCNKDDRYGTGAMLSGRHNGGGGWGNFTFAFLTLEDISFSAPAGTLINGVNALNIARISGEGKVVIETGPVRALATTTYDKYAIQFPAFNCVPPGRFNSLTLSSFYRGLVSYERTHIANLYVTHSPFPVWAEGGLLVIDSGTFDVFTSAFNTTTGGWIKVGSVALDQGTYVVSDPSNLLHGEISYQRGTGAMGIIGGANLVVKRIGEDSRIASLSTGAVTYGNAVWAPQGQTSRGWYSNAFGPNGDMMAVVFGGRIYEQVNSMGALVPLADSLFVDAFGTQVQNWSGSCITPDGTRWAAIYNGKIAKQPGGTGNWSVASNDVRAWLYMAADASGGIYATVYNNDIYYKAPSSDTFSPLGVGAYPYGDITVCPVSKDVYVQIYGGDISRRPGGTGTFGGVGTTSRNWSGIGCDKYDNVFSAERNGDVYKRSFGVGSFTAMGTTSRAWYSIKGSRDGRVVAMVSGGDAYTQLYPLYSASPLPIQ